MEEKNIKEVLPSLKEVNQEFTALTLKQIRELSEMHIGSIDPLILKEVRENMKAINDYRMVR